MGKRKAEDDDDDDDDGPSRDMRATPASVSDPVLNAHKRMKKGGEGKEPGPGVNAQFTQHNTGNIAQDEISEASGNKSSETYSEEDCYDEDDVYDEGDVSNDDDVYCHNAVSDEDEEDREYEVEEQENIIPGDSELVVKLRLYISKEEEFEGWLHNIHACSTYNGKNVGYAVGRYIRRERIRPHFWEDMEAPSQDMSDIAFELFDRYGYLKKTLKEHIAQRGTGAWGSELDFGSLFLIERIEITDRELRRKGLGRSLVNGLLRKAQKQEIFNRHSALHTIVLPGWLRSDVDVERLRKSDREQREINDRALDSAVAFFRSVGFRRIGASNCLGLSFDPEHKSKLIARQDDFDPLIAALEEMSDDEDEATIESFFGDQKLKSKRLDRLKRRLPLHDAIVTLPDTECVEFYKTFTSNDGVEWRNANHIQDTVLHIAACQLKPRAVEWLMNNVNEGQYLTSARNLMGYTPLEALQNQLETNRTQRNLMTMKVNVSDQFIGFPPEAVACLCILQAASNTQSLSHIQTALLAYGCTCGECLEGFLSPRMKLALLFQTEITHDMLDMDIGDAQSWSDWHGDTIAYVAPDLQRNFRTNKSLRQGFVNTFDYIASCLRSDTVPRRDNVLEAFENDGSEWPPVTRNYLERGGSVEGKIEAALMAIFRGAAEQDVKSGDGEFERVMEKEVLELKECRNDHEFGFVALACGLPELHGMFAGNY